MKHSCPKCSGRLVRYLASSRAPEHQSCLICGLYIDAPIKVVMPVIPDNGLESKPVNQYSGSPRLSYEEKRRRNIIAQRKHRAKVLAQEGL